MKLIKFASFLLIFTLAESQLTYGQVKTCFIKQMGLKTMTKDEFLKADSVRTDNKDYLVSGYTAVVQGTQQGKPSLTYRQLNGVIIPYILKELVASYDTCLVTFDEIAVSKKSDYPFKWIRVNVPFSISVK